MKLVNVFSDELFHKFYIIKGRNHVIIIGFRVYYIASVSPGLDVITIFRIPPGIFHVSPHHSRHQIDLIVIALFPPSDVGRQDVIAIDHNGVRRQPVLG